MATARKAFNGATDDTTPDQGATRISHVCPADGCQMPASVNLGGGFCCAWHAGAAGTDWPAITNVMQQNAGICFEINNALRLLNTVEFHDQGGEMHRALARLKDGNHLTQRQLDQLIQWNAGDLRTLLYNLQMLIGQEVQKVHLSKPKAPERKDPYRYKSAGDVLRQMYAPPPA